MALLDELSGVVQQSVYWHGLHGEHQFLHQPQCRRVGVEPSSSRRNRPSAGQVDSVHAIGRPAIARLVMPRMVSAHMRSRTESDRTIEARAVARAKTPEGAQVVANIWRGFATADYDLSGSEITAPALVVWGRHDPIVRREFLSEALGPIVESDTGHVAFSSDPDGFLAAALPFLGT